MSADVTSVFRRTFGHGPSVVASAPGRVNLIGEHTDHNGGAVLPIAIGQRTWIALHVGEPGTPSRAVSSNAAHGGEWDARHPRRTGEWWDYVSGVSLALASLGAPMQPLEIAISSDVPLGAGLSSSAAIEVATTLGIAALFNIDISKRDAGLLSQRVESEFVGVSCGIMDQFASALTKSRHALHVRCDTNETDDVVMNAAVLIFDTATPRSLRDSAYNVRRAECEEALALLRRSHPALTALAHASRDELTAARLPAPLDRRALHVVEETQRVQRAVDALRATGTIPGELLYESHESLRTLYECSTPELDWFVERTKTVPGVRGARLTGAGWGGCAIAVGEIDGLNELASAIAPEYSVRFGRTPRTWVTYAEDGARVDFVSPKRPLAERAS